MNYKTQKICLNAQAPDKWSDQGKRLYSDGTIYDDNRVYKYHKQKMELSGKGLLKFVITIIVERNRIIAENYLLK